MRRGFASLRRKGFNHRGACITKEEGIALHRKGVCSTKEGACITKDGGTCITIHKREGNLQCAKNNLSQQPVVCIFCSYATHISDKVEAQYARNEIQRKERTRNGDEYRHEDSN